jgi:energy-coupling factor transporter ATP-binding protein EcfA2
MIEVEALRYRYPTSQYPALVAPHWAVEAGEFVLLAGETGSGKTTLLRSLVSLVPHFYGGWFGGRVLVGGRDTRRHRPADLAGLVGYVGQEPETQTLLDRVWDEIAFALENLGFPPRVVAARVEEALDLLGLAHLRNRPIETLSGGERQRLTLASVLALQPQLLLLDEPTSQLDPWSAETVLEVLRRLVDELGITLVIAEHRLDRLLGSCTRLTLLEDGKIVADGSPQHVAERLPDPPILVQVSRLLGWSPPALSVAEGKRRLRGCQLLSPVQRPAPSPGPTLLALERIACRRGERLVLEDVTLEVARGLVTGIVGRNGSGKTTLLRAALGLEGIVRGRVWLDGRPVHETLRAGESGSIAYVPQYPGALLVGSRLRDDLELVARVRQVSTTAVDEIVDLFELHPLLDTHPADLSSGERQRAALAVALTGHPALIVLDEPTRGLGLRLKQRLASELRRRAAAGAAVLLTTHDVDFAAMVADRIVLLSEGRIVNEGPPHLVLGESFSYAPIVSRLFGPSFVTVSDVEQALRENPAPAKHARIGYTEGDYGEFDRERA